MPDATTTTTTRNDDVIAEYLRLRPRLRRVAFRILGNWTEAEDIVQDAWVRWQADDRTAVADPTAFLITMTTRLAINATTSARARREVPVGDPLPERVPTADDPSLELERYDDLALGLRAVLERLSPVERVAFVLRKAFDYPYAHIAAVLRTSDANARQLVSRAGRRVSAAPTRPVGRAEERRYVQVFTLAARHGDVGTLEDLLIHDAA